MDNIKKPIVSVIHPSFGRPELGCSTAKKWLDKAKNPENIEYIMCLSEKDTEDNIKEYYKNILNCNHQYLNEYENFTSDIRNIKVCECPEASLVVQTNFAAQRIATGDIISVISDDFDCPDNWDTLLIQGIEEAKKEKGIEDFFTVKTKDGIQPFISTLQIVDRKWYEKFGYILYPGYIHQYCDTDLTCMSHMLDRTLYVDLLFPHLHYSIGGMEKDEVNIKNDSTYNSGHKVFCERQASNFGLSKEEIINNWIPDLYTYDAFKK